MDKLINKVLVLVFLISLLLPRFIHIERPITVDELTWLTFSSDFLYGISNREFEHTYQDHHPGVTTMIAGTIAYIVEDRSYRAAQGYMENDTFLLIDRMEQGGYSIFDVLVTARTLMAMGACIALALSFWFLYRSWGMFPAWVVMMFVILDPMALGQTRLYSHEGLMSSLVFLSFAGFYHYTYHGRKRSSLLISGLALGFALLTKITALGLAPVIGLMLLVEVFKERNQTGGNDRKMMKTFLSAAVPVAVWFLIALIVFIAIWPAAWQSPFNTIVHMVDHTFSAFASSEAELESAGRSLSTFFEGISAYLHSIWAHATLLTWFGNFVVLITLVFFRKSDFGLLVRQVAPYLYLFAGIFVIVIGGMGSFRADRYMTSVHFFLALLSGIGVLAFLDWVKDFKWKVDYQWVAWGVVILLLAAQFGMVLPAAPYYYTYLNPLEGEVWWGVHGAFLDQAAVYLAEKPEAESLTAMTFSPGSFMFFFPGETLFFQPRQAWNERDVQNLTESDYLVVNFEISHLENPPRILSEIADVDPEHTISFQGREYVWIYRVDDLPESVFMPDPKE